MSGANSCPIVKIVHASGQGRGMDDQLYSPAEVAGLLKCSQKTLTAHVRAGELRYVNVGRGAKKPRRMFTLADVRDFVARRTQRDSNCQFFALKEHRSTTMTSKSGGNGFMAQHAARAAAKLKAKGD